MMDPPVGVLIGGFEVFESLQKAPLGGSRELQVVGCSKKDRFLYDRTVEVLVV